MFGLASSIFFLSKYICIDRNKIDIKNNIALEKYENVSKHNKDNFSNLMDYGFEEMHNLDVQSFNNLLNAGENLLENLPEIDSKLEVLTGPQLTLFSMIFLDLCDNVINKTSSNSCGYDLPLSN